MLSLGITNPLVRVAAWMGGCASASVVGALLGPVAFCSALVVLAAAVAGRLIA